MSLSAHGLPMIWSDCTREAQRRRVLSSCAPPGAAASVTTPIMGGNLALIGNSRGAPDAAERRVARGAGPGGPARKGPSRGRWGAPGRWGRYPRQNPLIRGSHVIEDFRSGLGPACETAFALRSWSETEDG
jgi:hypothetical protein